MHRVNVVASHIAPAFTSAKMSKQPVRVLITGAAGQIAYSLIPMVAKGQMLGEDQPVILHLLDIPPMMTALKGVEMEIVDCAYKTVVGVVATDDPAVAFKDIDYALLVGSRPRGKDMERKELLELNGAIFKAQGTSLNQYAKPNVKVLVVGNPANTNCLIAMTYADKIPKKNFSALTRLDHNRCKAQIALRMKTTPDNVKKVTIWGNHSSTQYPDVCHATVNGKDVYSAVNDKAYLEGDFISCVQKRGAAIIEARKLSSAMSAANAIVEHMRDWIFGTQEGDWVSMAVASDGSYGIEEGLCYSYPVTCKDGEYSIVQGLDVSEFSRNKMDTTKAELLEEKSHAL